MWYQWSQETSQDSPLTILSSFIYYIMWNIIISTWVAVWREEKKTLKKINKWKSHSHLPLCVTNTLCLTPWPCLYTSLHMVHMFHSAAAYQICEGFNIQSSFICILLRSCLCSLGGWCVITWTNKMCGSSQAYLVVCIPAQMLMQLKNLALEAETELERQDDVLDVLTSSTDRATMHIEKHTCRMKKLL